MTHRLSFSILLAAAVLLGGASCSLQTDLSSGSLAARESADPSLTSAPSELTDSLNEHSQDQDDLNAPSPTPDNRLAPEDWQDWPVIPELSPAMIEVYNRGIAQGNRADAFSKVGDCQIIPDVFLGIFDNPTFVLPEDMVDLQGTLDQYKGSFAREGYALKGGFVFPTVFSPLRADSSVCEPGETPYECELRLNQPAFVLISMEFRYNGRTAETHENYLRKAVEYALSRNIVPILATKADNFEGDDSLNLTTARIAYEYDIPLWNYWRAVQHLPEHGIDWERDSYGFHVTPAAWWERSETFLRVLDALNKDILASSAQAASGPALQTPQADGELSSAQAIAQFNRAAEPSPEVEDWGKGKLVFDIKRRAFGNTRFLGIYIVDLDQESIQQVSADGTRLLGVSPNFQSLLFSSGTSLDVFHLASQATQEISSSLFIPSPLPAIWDPDGSIVYLDNAESGPILVRYDPTTGGQEVLNENSPVSVLAADHGSVVWGQGSCSSLGDCSLESLRWMDSSGALIAEREVSAEGPLPCQTSRAYVYSAKADDQGLSFHIQSLETLKENIFWSLKTEYADCAWSPDGADVAVTLKDRGWYSGELLGYYLQILHVDQGTITDLSFMKGVTDQVSWSPDGHYLAAMGTLEADQKYQIDLSLLDLESRTSRTLGILDEFQSEEFTAIDHLYWLP